ncbi:MAG: hypothetical protein AAFU60_11200 [Bacteroidota bacterium]
MSYYLLLSLLLSILTQREEIVYGEIDYLEVLAVQGSPGSIDWYERSKAVGVIIPKDHLLPLSDGNYQIKDFRLREEIEQLDPNHPFFDQICVGIGTVFLVDSNRIMTAGHLVKVLY